MNFLETDETVALCADCRYWEPLPSRGDLGVCRRFAPRPVIVADDAPAMTEPWWPITAADDFCGDGDWLASMT